MSKASPARPAVDSMPRALERLVEAHRKLNTEPLHLAVHFQRPRNRHVNLLEILGGFGGAEPSPDRKFFEVAFGSTKSFLLPPGQELRLLLTSPEEFKTAVSARWNILKALRDSRTAGTARILYQDDIGKRLWNSLA